MMNSYRSGSAWWLALGAGLGGLFVGFAVGVGLAWLAEQVEQRRNEPLETEDEHEDLPDLEAEVLAQIVEDPDLRRREIQVTALARGIVELSGAVGSRAEAFRAVRLAHEVPGVRTVLNRLLAPEEMAPRDDLTARTRRAGSKGNGEAL